MGKIVGSSSKRIPPRVSFQKRSNLSSFSHYQTMYNDSITRPERFWSVQAEELEWFEKWDKVYEWDKQNLKTKWFEGGKINISYNCLDRHLKNNGSKVAIIWEPESGKGRKLTYRQLHKEVCRFANVLKNRGIKKGDRVCFYMPMIPELAIGMLACTRIGAIHNVVFSGFSPESLKNRILDSKSKVLITSNANVQGGDIIRMKNNVDTIINKCKTVKKVIVVKRSEKIRCKMRKGKDVWWHDEMKDADSSFEPVHMKSEDNSFILYDSSVVGKPRGVVHSTAGYLMYAYLTFKYVFDYQEGDVHWCTSDLGRIAGHSYVLYGPLANGATTLMYEGVMSYPEPDRYWKIIDKYKVNIFYTDSSTIRELEEAGNKWVNKCNLSSLRLLGSLGESINPKAWLWYWKVVGKKRCPIVDTWMQAETGGIMITPLPGAMHLSPGSACLPFFGVKAQVLRQDGQKTDPEEGGYITIEQPWPGMFRNIWGNRHNFKNNYFTQFKGSYFTGDGAKKDKDDNFWIMGRVDEQHWKILKN